MINYSRSGYEIKRDFTNFSLKISRGLKRPQVKFVHQMVYGILAGNKVHLSEIARSLKENITLKKTIDRLSRNLNVFEDRESLMHNYLNLVKRHVKDDYAVIIIDNSDIAKPTSKKWRRSLKYGTAVRVRLRRVTLPSMPQCSPKMEKCHSRSMKKCFQQRKKGFISETCENLCCLESLSENFTSKCVRTLDLVLMPMTITAIF